MRRDGTWSFFLDIRCCCTDLRGNRVSGHNLDLMSESSRSLDRPKSVYRDERTPTVVNIKREGSRGNGVLRQTFQRDAGALHHLAVLFGDVRR